MINNLLTSVYDVLVYDDKFFVSGNIDTKKSTCTNGIVRISSGYSSVIYESQIKGTWGMSKLNDAKFLVILYSQILFMDVRTDRVIKEMDFPFRIQAALHVKDCLVVSSLGKVFIINEVGEQLFTFLRYKTFKTSISQSSTNLSLTKDKHGNIYVCLLDGKTFILDLNLRLKAVCDLRIERSMYSTKICFDEERGLLLAFNSPGRLLTYELWLSNFLCRFVCSFKIVNDRLFKDKNFYCHLVERKQLCFGEDRDLIVETVVFILIQVLYNYRNSRNIIFELTHVMHVCFKLPF